jgi:hypothetical protein
MAAGDVVMRRRLLPLLSVLLAPVLALALASIFSRAASVGPTQENFRRIHLDMSIEEVRKILGPPTEAFPQLPGGPESYWIYIWQGHGCRIIIVARDDVRNGCLNNEDGSHLDVPFKPPSFWQRLRQSLRW